MNILTYNLIILTIYPFIILYFLIRLFINKENYNSFSQKLFPATNQINYYDFIVHVSSVGELNSIDFLFKKLFINKKVLLTCSTLTSYQVASTRYLNQDISFLPIDMFLSVKAFLKKNQTKKFIWIDSEIWPNYLFLLNKKQIKSYLVNARISDKSYKRWSLFPIFIKKIGAMYEAIIASSQDNQEKFYKLFGRKINFYGNLKFYREIYIDDKVKKTLCFGSIHKQEFNNIIEIISKFNLENFDEIIIIPRHPYFVSLLQSEIDKNNLNNIKIKVVSGIGKNIENYRKSKITFMGGSLFNHGGQNPLEPISCGSFVLSGPFISNFNLIYKDLAAKDFCHIFNDNNYTSIAEYIEKAINSHSLMNRENIKDLFNKKINKLNDIVIRINND